MPLLALTAVHGQLLRPRAFPFILGFQKKRLFFWLAQPLNHSTRHLYAPRFLKCKSTSLKRQMTSAGPRQSMWFNPVQAHPVAFRPERVMVLYICVHAQVLHTHIYDIEGYMYCVHSYIYLARYGGGEVKSFVKRLRNRAAGVQMRSNVIEETYRQ